MKSKNFTFWAGIILLWVGLIVSGSSADTIIVDPNGSGDFDNIQEAINASWNGDTIIVRQGTYNENVYFNNRAVTLSSDDPNNTSIVESTIITGGVTFDWAETAESVLTGFTVTDSGIHCIDSSPTISKNIIKNCSYWGILCNNSCSPTISENIITNCSRGGIRGSGNSEPNIVSNTITNNTSNDGGGGVYNCDGPITNNTITGNSVTTSNYARGGGLYGCDGTITNNTITGNSVTTSDDARGGGLADCSGTIGNNTILNNTAISSNNSAFGGGLYNCSGTITDNTIANNTVTTTDSSQTAEGGGLYGCDGTITNNIITDNSATSNVPFSDVYGGGLAYCGGIINNNTIADNNASSSGNADYAYGGGLYQCNATIINNIIVNNTANSNSSSAYGGGLYQCNGTIANNVIANNIASSETLYAYGGGLSYCTGIITNNTITSNTATTGGSDAHGGGLINCDGPIKNNIIAFNEADNSGGGIYNSSGNSYNDLYMNEPDNFGGSSSVGTGDFSRDPLFADAAAGDYHLKSEVGRWDPNSQSWVVDQETSFCIDAGDPGDDYSAEPLPNGGRINMGAYGGTTETSKTNVGYVLTLLIPNGGEQIAAGEIYIISWSSNYPGGAIVIDYSTDNGQSWNAIATIEDRDSYEWLVPTVASEECLVRITSVTYPAVNDVSDNVFEIFEPILSLIKPNGGEAILRGSTYDIVWSSELPSGDVLIEYSTDNGQNWSELITTEDTGSYQWQVSTPVSNQSLIRITDANDTDVNDTSDNIFSIYSCDELMAGDLNADCFVDMVDFVMLANNWLNESDARIFYSGLDNNPNWTTQGQWAFGEPTANGGTEWGNPDPGSGHTGNNVYGVNLNGDYNLDVGGPYNLTAGPFDCSKFHDIKLRFARWLNTDEPDYVESKIQVSNDGTIWHTVWENTTEVTDSSWQIVEYDVSEIADNQPTVYFRWSYEILDDRAYLCSGWNIDDIELLGKP